METKGLDRKDLVDGFYWIKLDGIVTIGYYCNDTSLRSGRYPWTVCGDDEPFRHDDLDEVIAFVKPLDEETPKSELN